MLQTTAESGLFLVQLLCLDRHRVAPRRSDRTALIGKRLQCPPTTRTTPLCQVRGKPPSRRNNAPTSPASRPASSNTQSVYCDVKRSRFARSRTSGSGLVVLGVPCGTSTTKDRCLPLSAPCVLDLISCSTLRPIYYIKIGENVVSLM